VFEFGLWVILVGCVGAVVLFWLGTERPPRSRGHAHFKPCRACFAEVRWFLAECPRCGASFHAEEIATGLEEPARSGSRRRAA
jgi:hypothetical protein